ncbi:MAG: MltA domain-containing protein [Phycisphaerae bacterium]|nr:MltA domain-containing protein [Phycisphaerae bacterium]
MRRTIVPGLLLSVVVLTGCHTKRAVTKPQYDRPLPPGQLALRKVEDPSLYPDFTGGWRDLDSLRTAIRNSLNYFAKPSSKQFYPYDQISHDQAVGSLQEFLRLLDSGARPEEINGLIAAGFDVYESVGCDDQGTVLFTGYYTPIFEGSREQTDQFRYPLYKAPTDLVKGPDGETLGRRGPSGQITPYPARAQIDESGMLQGQELIWLGDPFETYIAHVQGSAKVRLPDGRIVTVGYAATNGHEYASVAEHLVADGKIAADRISLATMIDYFKEHPEEVNAYVRANPRYVFFQSSEGTPRGSLNEPVIPWRTIATDKSIFPRGCLTFLATTLPSIQAGQMSIEPYGGFALDQDTGGAIRAPGRCDIYMGEGDEAGQLAGQTYQEGRLYYLFVRPESLASEPLTGVDPKVGIDRQSVPPTGATTLPSPTP